MTAVDERPPTWRQLAWEIFLGVMMIAFAIGGLLVLARMYLGVSWW